MQQHDWLSFIKPRLAAGSTMQQATVEYFKQRYPETFAQADAIAETIIHQSELLRIPDDSGYPEEAINLVLSVVESRLAE